VLVGLLLLLVLVNFSQQLCHVHFVLLVLLQDCTPAHAVCCADTRPQLCVVRLLLPQAILQVHLLEGQVASRTSNNRILPRLLNKLCKIMLLFLLLLLFVPAP
jgi:hypothetical protein